MTYTYWRRELAIKESQEIEALRSTVYWPQAMTELAFKPADLEADFHNVRMVAARAQQLKEGVKQ